MRKTLTTTLALAAFIAAPVTGQDPATAPDDTWISVTGTVSSVSPDLFVLEYSDGRQMAMAGMDADRAGMPGMDTARAGMAREDTAGMARMDTARAEMGRMDTARAGMAQDQGQGQGQIIVEMDDGDRDADAYQLAPGDTVTVTGWIDDDLFETRTIEATAVHVHNLDTWFFASGIDEEDRVITVVDPVISSVVARGIVTSVSDEEFTLASGAREVTVEVEDMPYNPLDAEGYQQIQVGDEVSVTGFVDYDFLEGREIVATSVTTLR